MPHAGPDIAGLTVLVAEGEVVVGFELQATRRVANCAVLGPVLAVRDVLALLGRALPDVALINAHLQDGEATPLAEALRRHGVPVGLVTGHAPKGLVPALRGLPLLTKPHRPGDVVGFVQRLTEAS